MAGAKAQTEGVLVESIGDEVVVYDTLRQQAHSLTAPAATIWSLCDGLRSEAAIAAETGLDTPIVDQALLELSERGLLVDTGETPRGHISRRDVVLRAGAGALAAPLIYSLAVNPALAAASPGTSATGTLTAQHAGTDPLQYVITPTTQHPSGSSGNTGPPGNFAITFNEAGDVGTQTQPVSFPRFEVFYGTDAGIYVSYDANTGTGTAALVDTIAAGHSATIQLSPNTGHTFNPAVGDNITLTLSFSTDAS